MYLPVRAAVARTRVTVAAGPPIVCSSGPPNEGAVALVPAEAWVQFPALEFGAARWLKKKQEAHATAGAGGARRTLVAWYLHRWHEARAVVTARNSALTPARSRTSPSGVSPSNFHGGNVFSHSNTWFGIICFAGGGVSNPPQYFTRPPNKKAPNPNETRVRSSASAHMGGRLSFGRLASCSKPGVWVNSLRCSS